MRSRSYSASFHLSVNGLLRCGKQQEDGVSKGKHENNSRCVCYPPSPGPASPSPPASPPPPLPPPPRRPAPCPASIMPAVSAGSYSGARDHAQLWVLAREGEAASGVVADERTREGASPTAVRAVYWVAFCWPHRGQPGLGPWNLSRTSPWNK